MKKSIFRSKTLWGFGIAGLIVLAQSLGVYNESTIIEVVKVVTALFGTYGLRDSIA